MTTSDHNNPRLIGIGFAILTVLTVNLSSLNAHADEALKIPTVATADNLETFELTGDLTAEEQFDAEQAEHAESSGEFDRLNDSLSNKLAESMTIMSGKSPNVVIEIFQNAGNVGKQFLIAREFGRIRYVFAVSAAGHGKSTPSGVYGVESQEWRHMSGLYPSAGENNMDHVTFFNGGIGFHSTTTGLYRNLGRADSHGCVRMGRPESRKIYMLIKNNGAAATIISRKVGDAQDGEVGLIKKMLAKDFNFVQWMLDNKNKGDIPFNESEYRAYLEGSLPDSVIKEKMKRMGLKQIIEVPRDQDLGPFSAPGLMSVAQ
ncbi:MAG: L,D-transpeptidase [Bdellovibrionota bacterium]